MGGQVQLDFFVTNNAAGMTFQLWKAPEPTAGWALGPGASLSTLIAHAKFRATTTNGSAPKTFYRIKGSY